MKRAGHPVTPQMPTNLQTPSQFEFKRIIRCCYKSKSVSENIIQNLKTSADPNTFMKDVLDKVKKLPSYKAYEAMKPKFGNLIGKKEYVSHLEDD